MSRAVFYCGSAGVGKSTLINAITGERLAIVSDRMLKDGTEGVQRFVDPSDKDLSHIDLPGLDSRNFPTQVTEKIQTLFPETKLLAVLVLSRQDGRITSFIHKFNSIKKELVGDEAKFAIIWTRDADVSAENIAELKKEYPTATMFGDDDRASIRAFFADPLLFKKQNQAIAKETLATVAIQRSLARPAPSASVTTAPQPPKVQPFLLGPPSHLLSLPGLRVAGPPDIPHMNNLVQKLFEIKKLSLGAHTEMKLWTPAEQKQLTGDTFKHYHLLGDAMVNMLAQRIVYANNINSKTFEGDTDEITGNGLACPMPRFFEKYLRKAHDIAFPNEKNISGHGQTDVVEALLQLALSSGKVGTRIFCFMIKEFFVLAGKGAFVGK